jgi:hypothetical protein
MEELTDQDPSVWGRHWWLVIDALVAAYPENPSTRLQTHMKAHMESLQYVLPCAKCRGHYAEHIEANPIDAALLSKLAFYEWIAKLKFIMRPTPNATPEPLPKNSRPVPVARSGLPQSHSQKRNLAIGGIPASSKIVSKPLITINNRFGIGKPVAAGPLPTRQTVRPAAPPALSQKGCNCGGGGNKKVNPRVSQ